MKKFYTLALSLVVACGVNAASYVSSSNNVAKANLTTVAQSAELQDNVTVAKNVKSTTGARKAQAKAPVAASDIIGNYTMNVSFTSSNTTYEATTAFEIVAGEEENQVILKNFLADLYGEVNDLTATIYDEEFPIDELGNTTTLTFLQIDLGQTYFIDEDPEGNPINASLYLYGPYSDDGKNYTYTASEIEFLVGNGILMAAYTNMGMKAGFIYDGGLYGYPAICGPNAGKDDMEAYKCNATISGTQFVDDEETTPFTSYLVTALYEDETETSILIQGLMGYNVVTQWIVDKENMTATATNMQVGTYKDRLKTYKVYLTDVANTTTDDFIAVANLSTNADYKTVMTFESQLLAVCDLGWLRKYDAGAQIVFDTNLFPTGEEGGDEGGEEGGVDAIEADNAPVKYYNLQGVQIQNPTQGNVVIRVKGNKAEKILVK